MSGSFGAHRYPIPPGDGKYMRHVKLRPNANLDASSLDALIVAAYLDIKARQRPP
jgi:hypothetical protein